MGLSAIYKYILILAITTMIAVSSGASAQLWNGQSQPSQQLNNQSNQQNRNGQRNIFVPYDAQNSRSAGSQVYKPHIIKQQNQDAQRQRIDAIKRNQLQNQRQSSSRAVVPSFRDTPLANNERSVSLSDRLQVSLPSSDPVAKLLKRNKQMQKNIIECGANERKIYRAIQAQNQAISTVAPIKEIKNPDGSIRYERSQEDVALTNKHIALQKKLSQNPRKLKRYSQIIAACGQADAMADVMAEFLR